MSEAVEATIKRLKATIADPELAWLFENCFPNTLDTTVHYRVVDGKPDTFVITGDIEAMWLRDSAAQVWPFVPLTRDDRHLRDMIAGVIRRHASCIIVDPYANAFNDRPRVSAWANDLTDMKPELHERKYEIDSLCYPIRLAHGYWRTTGDASLFDETWRRAMVLVVKTFHEQQRMWDNGPYRFQRWTAVWYDTVPLGGYGNPTRRCGLIHSAFRPSDDSCVYPFLLPSNIFAVIALRSLSEIWSTELRDTAFARECAGFADDLQEAIGASGIVHHPKVGPAYAYEIDGFGNALFMDDANVPSLLSLPYLGWCIAEDPTYRTTRSLLLSEDNPYFFRGAAGEGIGGPHVGLDMIWPMAIIIRALTSTDDAEILQCLRTLTSSHAGTGFMHESFHKDDPTRFTRPWFAWANTLFGELILRLSAERPHLLTRQLD